MAGSSGSASKAADLKTKAKNKSLKQTSSKVEKKKNQAQKEAHNKSCQKSRLKKKRRVEELEEMAAGLPEMVDQNKRMKLELQKIPDMENAIQLLMEALQQKEEALQLKAANEVRGWQIISMLIGNGQNISSFDELVAWFTSQHYGPIGEGSNYANQPSIANHYWNASNLNDTNILTHPFAGCLASSPVANNDLIPGLDPLNYNANDNDFIHHFLANELATVFDPPPSASNDGFAPHPAADNQATNYLHVSHGFSF